MRWLVLPLFLFFVACGADGPSFELIEEGRGPKRALRYNVEAGKSHELVMSMKMGMMGRTLPEIRMTMEITILSAVPGGDIRYSFRFTDASASNGMELPGLDDLMGLSGTAVVDARGMTRSGQVNVPPGTPPAMKQFMSKFEESIKQFSCPFPEEPVGVGAKWKLSQPITTEMFGLQQEATFQLVELDGDRGRLKMTLRQHAEDVEMKLPNGMTAELVELESKGSGEMEFDLKNPAPIDSYLDLETRFKVKVQGQTIAQTMHISMGFKTK